MKQVVTIGGLHGIVDEVNKAKRTVVLDCEGVYLTFELSAISTVKEGVVTTAEVTETEVVEDEYDAYDAADEVEGEYSEEEYDQEHEYASKNS